MHSPFVLVVVTGIGIGIACGVQPRDASAAEVPPAAAVGPAAQKGAHPTACSLIDRTGDEPHSGQRRRRPARARRQSPPLHDLQLQGCFRQGRRPGGAKSKSTGSPAKRFWRARGSPNA